MYGNGTAVALGVEHRQYTYSVLANGSSNMTVLHRSELRTVPN